MATQTTLSPLTRPATWTLDENDTSGVESRPVPTPPREVWPLLGTIAGYQLTMLGVLLWFAVPGVRALSWADLFGTVALVAALAAALWLVIAIARPAHGLHVRTA